MKIQDLIISKTSSSPSLSREWIRFCQSKEDKFPYITLLETSFLKLLQENSDLKELIKNNIKNEKTN